MTGLQPERPGAPGPPTRPARRREPLHGPADRWALWLLLGAHVALEIALLLAGWTLYKYLPTMPLPPAQKVMFEVGIALAFVAFGVRALRLWRKLRRSAPPPVR